MPRLLLAVFMVLAACGAPEARPAPPPPPSPSASPSTSPPLSPSPMHIDTFAPPGFVDLADIDPTILHDIRYFTDHNFIGRPIAGYLEPRCLLTTQAAQALRQAQVAARAKNYSLKVYDCYRPARAVRDFAQWATTSDAAMKAEFFPNLSKPALFTDGFIGGTRSAHSRGSTIDLTLVALPAVAQRAFVKGEPLLSCTTANRFPDNTIDMGTGYDCFDTLSHTLDGRIGGVPRENRLLLRQFMTDAGFVNQATEWWHYRLVNDPHPTTYFDFPVARAALR